MLFKLRVQHIDRDFEIHDEGVEPWELEIAEENELIIFLNRVAIASSHTTSVEHPELEISVGTKRATVKAIKGQLFFSDLNKFNVQNLRVIAEEIVGFLTDRIMPGAHEMEGREEEEWQRLPRYRDQGRRTAEAVRAAAFAMLLTVLVFCAVQVWEVVQRNPRLVHHPDFEPGLPQAAAFLHRHSGTYIDAVKDSGQIIEIAPDGRFRLYEMWRKPNGKAYTIRLVEDYSITAGMSGGKGALLVADYYLLIPDAEGRISMFGKVFSPYDRKRDSLGLWPEAGG